MQFLLRRFNDTQQIMQSTKGTPSNQETKKKYKSAPAVVCMSHIIK
jgi:hypothetical protein